MEIPAEIIDDFSRELKILYLVMPLGCPEFCHVLKDDSSNPSYCKAAIDFGEEK
jgi:hypothetical protein